MTISEFFKQFLLSLFENPFHSLASGKILPLIVFSIIIGVALNDRKVSLRQPKMSLLVFMRLCLRLFIG